PRLADRAARRGRRRPAGVPVPALPDRPPGEPPAARGAAGLRPARVRAAAPLALRLPLRRERPDGARPRPAAEREVRRQLDRPVLAQPARRLEPRLPRRRPRRDSRAAPPLRAG